MANRVFQGRDLSDERCHRPCGGRCGQTGTIISCTDLNRIGEVRDGVASERLAAGDSFVPAALPIICSRPTKAQRLHRAGRGHRRGGGALAALLAISLQNVKSIMTKSSTKRISSKTCGAGQYLAPAIFVPKRARATPHGCLPRGATYPRHLGHRYFGDVVSAPDKQKDFLCSISQRERHRAGEKIKRGIDQHDIEKLALSIVDTLSGERYIKAVVGIGRHCQRERPCHQL